jgi:hypothetical protein
VGWVGEAVSLIGFSFAIRPAARRATQLSSITSGKLLLVNRQRGFRLEGCYTYGSFRCLICLPSFSPTHVAHSHLECSFCGPPDLLLHLLSSDNLLSLLSTQEYNPVMHSEYTANYETTRPNLGSTPQSPPSRNSPPDPSNPCIKTPSSGPASASSLF